MSRTAAVIAVLAVLVATATTARAEPPVADVHRDASSALGQKLRVPILAAEHLALLVPPAIMYWSTVDLQKEDWELDWNWSTWKQKLTSLHPLVLDTNRFEPNGERHELVGALTYQVGRANHLGVLGSTLVNFAASVFWEYVVECRERPSLNDIVENTASGLLIGEPLFQIGKVADGQGGLFRRGLGMLVSPWHRLQKATGLSPLDEDAAIPANRIELGAGANVTQLSHDPRATGELRLATDVEVMTDHAFALPGDEVTHTAVGGWNRLAAEVRIAERAGRKSIEAFRVRTQTTYLGRYARAFDEDGRGAATFVGLGGGFDLAQRRLATDTEHYSALQLVGPRAGGWVRSDAGELDWEVAATADVAMVSAHVFAGKPLAQDSSILVTRGYYYASAVTAAARVRARRGRWSAELEGTAHQFWSFDAHDYGGDDDPKHVRDQRVMTHAAIGVRPTSQDLRVELYGDAVVRRGTWEMDERVDTELSAGLAVTAAL